MKTVLSWLISPILLLVAFGGIEGYKWFAKQQPKQEGQSAHALILVKSMLNSPTWRLGKPDKPCIVNEPGNVIVWSDGRVATWGGEKFYQCFAQDRAYIAANYEQAQKNIGERLMARVFGKDVTKDTPCVSHDLPAQKEVKSHDLPTQDIVEVLKVLPTEVPELIPMPTEIEVLPMPTEQTSFGNLLRLIEGIQEPRRQDRAKAAYQKLLESLDLMDD
jgi:hypothetical protein